MLKQKIALLMAIALMVVSLSGCGASTSQSSTTQQIEQQATTQQNEVTNIWFYYPTQVGGDLANGMESLVAQFNQSNPNINVTAVYSGSYKQTAQKAMSDLAAGNGPNVILSGMLDIVDYYNVDMLQDMTQFIANEGEEWEQDFVDGFWGNFEMEDKKIYGLPFQHSVCVLYYNKDMLDAANVSVPTNWQEMIEATIALQEYDSKIVPVEFPADVWVLEALTMSNSASLINSTTETAFDSEQAIDSLDLLSQLIQNGGMINAYASAAEDFVAESCAMTFNTTGNLGFVASDATFNWDVAMLPVNTNPAFSYGGGGLIMTAGQTQEQQDASWEFMKYMTSPEVSAQWMATSGYFAVRKSAQELDITKEYYAQNPQLEHAAEFLQYTSSQWFTKSYWDVYACMQTALDSVLIDGNVSAQDALTKAQQEAMAILSK